MTTLNGEQEINTPKKIGEKEVVGPTVDFWSTRSSPTETIFGNKNFFGTSN